MGSQSLPLLGIFGASLDGQPLGRILTRPAQALLSYLACQLRLMELASAATSNLTHQVEKSHLRHKNDQHWS